MRQKQEPMFIPFVSDEHPVALYSGVPPQYTSEGLAIDCALVLHVLKGTARLRCNFEMIEEQADSVVLFNPAILLRWSGVRRTSRWKFWPSAALYSWRHLISWRTSA